MSAATRPSVPVHVCPSGIQRPPIDPGHFDAWRKLPSGIAESLVDVMFRMDDVAERDGLAAYDGRGDLRESMDSIMETLEAHPSARGVSTNRRWFGPVALELAIARRGRCPHCYRRTGQIALILDPCASQDDPAPQPRPRLPTNAPPLVLPSPAPRPAERLTPLPTEVTAEMARLTLAALRAKRQPR